MLEQLLRDMNSVFPEVRDGAIQRARSLPPEQLVELAYLEAKSNTKSRNSFWIVMSAIAGVTLLGGFLTCDQTGGLEATVTVILTILTITIFSGIWSLFFQKKRARRSLATIYANIDDINFVVLALSLLTNSSSDQEVVKSIKPALTRLLPRLRADHASAFPLNQRQTLTRLLMDNAFIYSNADRQFEHAFKIALLQALTQIGGEGEIAGVERFARTRIKGRDPTLDSTLEECLMALRYRKEHAHHATTLLRASGPSASPETLLRAAQSTGIETPPEQLLRPLQPPEL